MADLFRFENAFSANVYQFYRNGNGAFIKISALHILGSVNEDFWVKDSNGIVEGFIFWGTQRLDNYC